MLRFLRLATILRKLNFITGARLQQNETEHKKMIVPIISFFTVINYTVVCLIFMVVVIFFHL